MIRKATSVASLAREERKKIKWSRRWNYDRTETLVKGVEVVGRVRTSVLGFPFSFKESSILCRGKLERFFGKSDLESKEEGRVESPFFKSSVSVKESQWKKRSMEFPSRIYLYTWPPSSSLRTAKKRRLRGRETGHMSRARKKRVRTVSSRFYFGSCPFLLRISGTGEWREHEFHRFLTYSALLQPSCGRDTRWKTI